MPAVFFTTNESELTRVEGLYVSERNPPAAVAGVNLNAIGIAGETVRGPVDKPIVITGEARFKEVFGGRDYGLGGPVINKVWLSLLNKPFGTVVVSRACASGATTATHNFSDVTPTAILQVDASSPGAWGAGLSITIANATDGNVNHFNLTVLNNGASIVTYQNLDVSSTNDNTLSVVGDDDGNLVKLTKLAAGRPLNIVAQALSSSSNGTIADSDFTASGRGINVLAAYRGLGAVFVAERSSAALKSTMLTLAAASSDRLFIIGPDSETVSASSAETDVASYRNGRTVYTFNHAYTLDPETATLVLTHPESWMASIISQTDIDIHPGDEDSKAYTAGITRLYHESFTREDYAGFRAAGICALEKDDGFAFVSGVVTDLTAGKTEITRRRSADFINLSLAKALKHAVKKKNTATQRLANACTAQSFLGDLQKNERVVELFKVDPEALNTVSQRAAGLEKPFVQVKLLGHLLFLDLVTQIGTTVEIKEL